MKKILLTALLFGGMMATAGVTGNVFQQASPTDGRQSEPEVTNILRAEGENASEYACGNKWYGNAEWTSGDLTV